MADTLTNTVSILMFTFGRNTTGLQVRFEACFYGFEPDPTTPHARKETRMITLQFAGSPDKLYGHIHPMLDSFSAHLAAWLDSFKSSHDMAKVSRFDELTEALFASKELTGWNYAGLLLEDMKPGTADWWDLLFHVKKLEAQRRVMAIKPAEDTALYAAA